MKFLIPILFFLFTVSTSAQNYYFPPTLGSDWDTTSPAELDWCTDEIDSLYAYLEATNSKSFMVLKDGKIVLEKYMNGHSQDSIWYWASAGKTVMATLIGIAQKEGHLSIDDKTSDYLGEGWTSCSEEKEALITVKHQLTMTTGMNDLFFDCTTASCLKYVSDAGTRWSYHNGPYTLLRDVLETATGKTSSNYTLNKLTLKTGMAGLWINSGANHLFWSNTRSAARFGSLMLNQGFWKGQDVVGDSAYLNDAISTSQELNKSYGYLWWLNGKESFMLPASQKVTERKLVPSAPDDMYSALGKNGQIICIVPSQNLILIRFGEIPNGSFVPNEYVESIWQKFNKVNCQTNSSKETRLASLNDISIFPNPGNQFIKIQTSSNQEINKAELYNAQGELMQTSFSSFMKTEELTPGIYFLKVSTTQGGILVKKWIKA